MNQNHESIAITVGTDITKEIVRLLPHIQAHIAAGNPSGGLTARISFRAGTPPEGGVIAELEITSSSGPGFQYEIGMQADGDFYALNPPDYALPVAAAPITPSYPAAQMRLAPPPLVARQAPQPVAEDWVAPPAQPGLTGPMPAIQVPPEVTPEAYAAWYNAQVEGGSVQPAPAPAPAPVPTGPPKRIQRPMLPGEA